MYAVTDGCDCAGQDFPPPRPGAKAATGAYRRPPLLFSWQFDKMGGSRFRRPLTIGRYDLPKTNPTIKADDRDVAAAWDENASTWTTQVRAGHDRTHELFTSPQFMEFIPDLTGLSVIDLGCGEGRNTRSFTRRGALMTGVDISSLMVELARQEEAREPLGIRFEVESSAELRSFADASFDAAVSTMALMDTADFPAVAREAFRVIRPRGAFYFSVLHPCFMGRDSTWARDGDGRILGRMVPDYWSDKPYIEQWGFEDAPPFTIPYFPYRMEDYINGLCAAGFRIERIHEPRPAAALVEAYPEMAFLAHLRDHNAFVLFVAARKS
jgi:ubiquinone/menaquinone biosynthesis C-methylase UbiE